MIAPLILAIGTLTFGLFWLILCYSCFYVVKPETYASGQFYPKALFQLFTGLYVLEICLIGLFCLVQDTNRNPACLFQAGAMTLILGLTLLFHRRLRKIFCPLLNFPFMGLDDGSPEVFYIPALDSEKVFKSGSRAPDAYSTQDLLNAATGNQGNTVWIPKDGLGVSDDEIRWSSILSNDVILSNTGASINERGKVVYDRGPP